MYATNLFYRNPAATNVYVTRRTGMYNYAVIGAKLVRSGTGDES